MVCSCCAIGCTKSADLFRNLTFHRFPLNNLPLLQKWIKAVRRKDFTPTKSTKICSDHFVKDDYRDNCGRFLKPSAVPSIFNYEAGNQAKSKKILANEEDMLVEEPEQPIPLSEVIFVNEKAWDPLQELGLDSSQVELQFEDDVQIDVDEQPKLVHLSNSNVACNEIATQTFINKCKFCKNNSVQLNHLRRKIKRKEDTITRMKKLIKSLNKELAESKKRKIKVVGNSIIFVDQLSNNKGL